jgi:CIC family chloride channel protein
VIDHSHGVPFRPWLLWLIPALGGLCAGLISNYFAPETRGGGANAIIHAFHHQKGLVRKRVAFVKAIVSIFTLGSGGSGGREGPTMQMGGALGSLIGQFLGVSDRERRILLVAGTAAGMAAVFRTPLGAALLAVEVLHRDDFEADALVPSVLASVVSYSVFISFFGESTLFVHATRFPFIPTHLPLYGLMAVLVSIFAVTFVKALEGVRHLAEQLPLPGWSKPALGGLLLGIFATPILVVMSTHTGRPGHGLGIMGGGYGAAQLAITGIDWLEGWRGVQILLVLGAVKALATALTVGSGGSAGDFGPSLVLGALVGGAFGRAAQLVFGDPRLDPGAFALVGMGTFYGGLAHVPIAALVMVCELAGSYDLLVPLMLCEGIAFVALRRHTLYPAQLPTKRDSPAHRGDLILDVLKDMRVSEILIKNRPYVAFTAETSAREVIEKVSGSAWQDAFPVLSPAGQVIGMVSSEVLRTLASAPEMTTMTIAHDMMMPPITVRDTDDLRTALKAILEHSVRELIVIDAAERIVGFLDEAEITRIYHTATAREAAPIA